MKKTETRTKHAPEQNAEISQAGTSSNSSGGHYPSHAEIKELIELISEKQFSEFELVLGGFRLYLLNNSTSNVAATVVPPTPAAADSITDNNIAQSIPALVNLETSASAATVTEEESLQILTSPIVGTFYRSSSPESDPFVDLGDQVERGEILCIIEAMKLMNEIPSEVSGTIARVFVDNGQAVEYGQPLFGIK